MGTCANGSNSKESELEIVLLGRKSGDSNLISPPAEAKELKQKKLCKILASF